MAEFDDACQQKGILLFCLPPGSPNLNGRVERANRTYREAFYDCSTATPTVAGFRSDLRAWEHTYLRYSWYEPLRDAEAIKRGVGYVLARPSVFLNTSSEGGDWGFVHEPGMAALTDVRGADSE